MEKQEITVTISGEAGIGKTIVATIIQSALAAAEIETEFHNEESDADRQVRVHKAIKAIAETAYVKIEEKRT